MKSGSCDSIGSFDVRVLFRAFLIGLAFLSVSAAATRTMSAQKAPEKYVYYLTHPNNRVLDHVCAGEYAVVTIIAERKLAGYDGSASPGGGQDTNPQPVIGATLNGVVVDPTYGRFDQASLKTKVGLPPPRGLGRPEPPGSADFFFQGLKPGRTQLRFTGRVNGLLSANRDFLPVARDVRVIPCKLKVSTSSTWNAGMEIVATIEDAIMEADHNGHFTGTAKVTWTTSVISAGGGCSAAEIAGPASKAWLTSDLDESDQLVVKIEFQSKDFSGFGTCGPVSVSTANLATPDDLTITVPHEGGSATQMHGVSAKNGSFSGSASIVVTPEAKK